MVYGKVYLGISRNMNEKVKVLQVTSIAASVKTLLLPLIDGLVKNHFQVDICCANDQYANHLRDKGYNVIIGPFRRKLISFSHVKSLFFLCRLIKKDDYDIIHLHTPIIAAIGRISAKLARKPTVIYTAHGFYFHEDMNFLMKKAFIFIEMLLARWATDWLFTQSLEDAESAKILQFMKNEERIIWIGNGVEIEKFAVKYQKEKIKKELNLDNNKKVILFIGRLVEEKGIIELIEAFYKVKKQCADVKLLCVGETLESDRDKKTYVLIKSLIQKLELQKDVILTGFRDDIPVILSVADVFVLPSHREGMPRTIIEAMASGKPVIATDIRGCREEVIHEKSGLLVKARDLEGIADAIMRIISDEELAGRMGEEGRKRAEELFDEKQVIERQLEVYKEIKKSIR